MDDATAAMTPEQRLAAGLCAECGEPLADIDVTHHSMQHWPQYIRPDGTNNEAIRRQGLMADYAASHPPISTRPLTGKPPTTTSSAPSTRS